MTNRTQKSYWCFSQSHQLQLWDNRGHKKIYMKGMEVFSECLTHLRILGKKEIWDQRWFWQMKISNNHRHVEAAWMITEFILTLSLLGDGQHVTWGTVTCSLQCQQTRVQTRIFGHCSIFNQTKEVHCSVICGEREVSLAWDVQVTTHWDTYEFFPQLQQSVRLYDVRESWFIVLVYLKLNF